ncbi:hypothetical protein N7539_001647 [Penicillium diatomitis]|uniref:Uncharacterized protein n=1 Tax=Penicillium diatomitis TaxID=2819901 RepID=A0A9W9XH62_9EURO|nr:uncharacterized protein N7539_001647 [Penicillium diatomitis]KAJ5492901.1 hypothetical protein N7539_001647 [Penicillium diatomitis]
MPDASSEERQLRSVEISLDWKIIYNLRHSCEMHETTVTHVSHTIRALAFCTSAATDNICLGYLAAASAAAVPPPPPLLLLNEDISTLQYDLTVNVISSAAHTGVTPTYWNLTVIDYFPTV